MFKYFLSFSAIVLLASATVDGQEKFVDGYIITNTGDTIIGKVAYSTNPPNSNICRFRFNEKVTEYTPAQLAGFGLSSKKFFTSKIVENAFVELLADGVITLYRKDGLYLQKSGGEKVKLAKIQSKIETDGKAYDVEDNRWRGLLLYAVSDSEIDRLSIQEMTYDEEAIARVVITYNQLKGSKGNAYYRFRPKAKINYGFLLVAAQTRLIVDKYVDGIEWMENSYQSTNMSVGVFFTVTLPGISEKLAFHTEANYIKSHFSSVSDHSFSTYYKDHFKTEIEYSSLTIPLGIRFTIFDKKYSLFILGGPTWDLNFKTYSYYSGTKSWSNIPVDVEGPAIVFRKTQLGYWAGIEILRSMGNSKVGLSFRYNHTLKLNAFEGFNVGVDRFSAGFVLVRLNSKSGPLNN